MNFRAVQAVRISLLTSVLSPLFSSFISCPLSTMASTVPASASASTSDVMPALFISHGGGPCFFMKGGMMEEMDKDSKTADFLRNLNKHFPAPKAVLMVSAHWESEPGLLVQSSAAPSMLFDYSGFPPETYKLSLPSPGHPELAKRTAELLVAAGIPCGLDSKRGYDHGTFVPLLLA
jgi:aromatic ring-opening dioxygenase catalytic subunit (LigB family)